MTNPAWLHKIHPENHEHIKDILLSYSELYDHINANDEKGVTKTDWFEGPEAMKSYKDYAFATFEPHIKEWAVLMGANPDTFELEEFGPWFHTYDDGSQYDWHTHTGVVALIYYAELPSKEVATKFFDPYTREVIQADVTEGDIIMFPPFIPHMAPPNYTGKRKTIFAGNAVCRYGIDKEQMKKFDLISRGSQLPL